MDETDAHVEVKGRLARWTEESDHDQGDACSDGRVEEQGRPR